MADQEIPAEALAAAEERAQYAYADWSTMPDRDACVHLMARRAARTAVIAAAPLLIEQGRRQAGADIEAHADKLTAFSFIHPPSEQDYDVADTLQLGARIARQEETDQ